MLPESSSDGVVWSLVATYGSARLQYHCRTNFGFDNKKPGFKIASNTYDTGSVV